MSTEQLEQHAVRSLARILPRLEQRFAEQLHSREWRLFRRRLEANFDTLFGLLMQLYSQRYDFFYHLEETLALAAQMWLERPAELKLLDSKREEDPRWFQGQRMVGGVCYVDLFAGNLAGVRDQIPYFKELGLSYLHLMPLYDCPAGNSDGGYAVSSFRKVNPALGSMAELRELAGELRRNGISLVLDFVFNHTSDEHEWALQALVGNKEYQDYYLMFPDRSMPDAYQATLREIFPDQRPGSFTYRHDAGCWVWTTFNSFQWDLNYANPAVFNGMAAELLFLANQGIEVLRLDAVAFIWKQLGTSCENLPQAHMLIQAFNTVVRIAAPALLFKSEAIVHPDDVVKYIGRHECQLSYNPLLMALLWNTLATRDVELMRHSLHRRLLIDPDTAWVNYVRGHDDIGWTFDDGDAWALGVNGFDHRHFLNNFYTGRFAGSFACGVPFQENPRTGDARIAGTCASLAGLEQALRLADDGATELAIRRIVLIHSVILTIGGIPLIYLGDELGTLNDYGYRHDPAKADDSRWVNRPATDWRRMERRHDASTVEGRIFGELRRLINIRANHQAFGGAVAEIGGSGNQHVFCYVRQSGGARVLLLANFSEHQQQVSANQIRLYGLGYTFRDLASGAVLDLQGDLVLEAYRFVWLETA